MARDDDKRRQVGAEDMARLPAIALTGFDEPWMVEWGEDKYGVFAVFAVGEVLQRMRWIPPGRFQMGSEWEQSFEDERPRHWVELSRGFWMGDTPVTQVLWAVVMDGATPSEFEGEGRPVERVSWEDVQKFLERLSSLGPGLRMRLPTEAEWEYACRAGTDTEYWSGDGEAALASVGWYGANSGRETKPVGQKPANPWGLHDVHGNVWEWCGDSLREYAASPELNPVGTRDGSSRVVRGGSWRNTARSARSAFRSWNSPGYRNSYLGFRLVRGLELEQGAEPEVEAGVEPQREQPPGTGGEVE